MGVGQFRKKKHHVLAKLPGRERAGLAIDDKISLASHTQFIRNSDRSLCLGRCRSSVSELGKVAINRSR